LAGGVFGMLLAQIPGFLAGSIIAGMYSAPIAITIALLMWAFWLTRYQLAAGILVGVLTGALSTFFLMSGFGSRGELIALPVIAGLLGGLGSWLATFFYRKKRRRLIQPMQATTASWQFSLKDLFIRFTVLSILAAAWSLAISYYVRER